MPISKDPEKRKKQIAQLIPHKKGQPNPNGGRKKNPLQTFLNEIERTVGEVPTPENIQKTLMTLPLLGEEQLKDLALDKDRSMLLRILSRAVLSNDGYKVIMELIQKTVGSKLDITSNGKEIKQDPIVVEVIDRTEQVRTNNTEEASNGEE